LRRHAEELAPVLPLDATLVDESQVHLVHERGRLQRIASAFTPEVGGSAPMEVAIHQRHHAIARRNVTVSPRVQQRRNVAGRAGHRSLAGSVCCSLAGASSSGHEQNAPAISRHLMSRDHKVPEGARFAGLS
jgi:hypothetical protein